MRYAEDFSVEILTSDGWETRRIESFDITQSVADMLKERGIKPKAHKTESPDGYRCAFHFWYSGKKKYGEPEVIAAAHQIYA